MIQTSNPGPYNIGQKCTIYNVVLRKHCALSPYLQLVAKCKDEYGFVTIRAVNTETRMVDIGDLFGSVLVPLEALQG
jgi:hypothetical protein